MSYLSTSSNKNGSDLRKNDYKYMQRIVQELQKKSYPAYGSAGETVNEFATDGETYKNIVSTEKTSVKSRVFSVAAVHQTSGAETLSCSEPKNSENTDSSEIAAFKLDFSSSNLVNALIMSEVLGKPKCIRRGR